MWANFISHCDRREQYFTIHKVNYFTFGASRIFHFLLPHKAKSKNKLELTNPLNFSLLYVIIVRNHPNMRRKFHAHDIIKVTFMSEYYMFNKPLGCITARYDPRHKTVMDYFPEEKRDCLFPVGRLDLDTVGFLLVTDDGELCYRLLRPEHHVPKTYYFKAIGTLGEEQISLIEGGIKIYKNSDLLTAPSKITKLSDLTYKDLAEYLSEKERRMIERRAFIPATEGLITITEGKKRQVRRMLRHVGCKIVYLKRVKMGDLELDATLKEGEYRPLTEKEIELLKSY